MKLHKTNQVRPDKSGFLCRQSRLRGTVAIMLTCLLLVALPFLWWFLEAPWPVWGGCALLAVVVVPLVIHDLLLRLRSSNWVLWIRPDGLWINIRSYQKQNAPGDTKSVVHVEFDEIERAERLVESYSTPRGHYRESTRHTEEALLIHLTDTDTSGLQQALAEERTRLPEERTLFGFVRVAAKASHFAVRMPSPMIIRIAWRGGHGNDVVPNLETVLDHLSRVAGIRMAVATEAVRRHQPDWTEIDEFQLDEHIRHLVDSGARGDAIQLLKRRKGYSATEAHKRIEELATQADNSNFERTSSEREHP